mgnify:CR=1 FL=1
MAQAQKTNGKSAPSTEELAAQIDQIKDDIGALTRMLAEYAGDKEQKAQDALKAKAQAAKDQGAVAMKQAQAQAEKLGAQTQDFVAHNPGLALGVAAGLGFLVGALGSRR